MLPQEKSYDFWLMINHGVDIKSRKIYLTGEIEQSYTDTCIAAIDYFNNPAHCPDTFKDPITVIINSPGGCIDHMFSLYEAIVGSEAEVHTVGTGQVCSAASLILACGDKRFVYETTWVMVHKISLELSGHDDEVISGAQVTQKMASRLWQCLGRHTKLSAGKWVSLIKKKSEVWMSAADLIERGVVDEIIRPKRRQFEPFSSRNVSV